MTDDTTDIDDSVRITGTMTPQEIVNAAVERKGAEYIRENFEAYFAPVRIMGIRIHRSQVEIPDDDKV
jgi:hypothetical protein